MQADQFAFLVEASGELAHRDRAIEIVRLIFLAAQDQLDWSVGEFLRDRDRLMHVVLRATAPAEAAAEIVAVHLALGGRGVRGFRPGGERSIAVRPRPPAL